MDFGPKFIASHVSEGSVWNNSAQVMFKAAVPTNSMRWIDISTSIFCGVGSGPKKALAAKNLHLPLEYAAGHVVRASTYNGYVIVAEDAAVVPIPMLRDGWNGRDRETTRCKNFQFAVAYFGSENAFLDVAESGVTQQV